MLLLTILALMVCNGSRVQARMIDGIVAVVDNKVIMDSDLRKKMIELGAPPDSRSAERQVLELMVEDIVIEKIYKSMGLPPVNEKDANKASTEMQCSLETARSFLRKSALMEMMVRSRVVITENMIKAYYDAHDEYQGKESVRLRQIPVDAGDVKMQKFLEDLKQGKSGNDPAGYADVIFSSGKDIGWIAMEDLSEEIARRIEKAKPGDVIGPVPSDGGGMTLYKYEEKRVMGTRKLDEVRGDIQKTLERKYQQEAFNYWLHKMMTQYFIGIYI
jgi:parvulin-like peptidyl-prolyl isomerase